MMTSSETLLGGVENGTLSKSSLGLQTPPQKDVGEPGTMLKRFILATFAPEAFSESSIAELPSGIESLLKLI